MRLKVIHLQAEQVYLGLYVECFIGKWPSKSGWSISGPGNYTMYQDGYVLRATYPRDVIPIEGRGSLDRTQLAPADSGHAGIEGLCRPQARRKKP